MEVNTEKEREKFQNKNIYTDEEKKYIMQQLNEQRIKERQKKAKARKYIGYTEEEKQDILKELNDRRLEERLCKEMEERRVFRKKIYHFGIKEYYKFAHMDREYFIEIRDMKKLSNRSQILTLYYRTFGEMKKKDFLMKTEVYSDRIFISEDMLRVYFKGYTLEDER